MLKLSKEAPIMKYEWRKQEKDIYGVKGIPVQKVIPTQTYLMIEGKGNPNDQDFSRKVSALYAVAYAVKREFKSMMSKLENDEMITDYTVYPLEGIWKQTTGTELFKEELEYTIMIRQPDFVSNGMIEAAFQNVKRKKPNPLYDSMRVETMQDGSCVQILHIGSYDEEPASFAKMQALMAQNHRVRSQIWHREIYLSNPSRSSKDSLKTILRYTVE